MNGKLADGLARLDLRLSAGQGDALETYIDAVLAYNRGYNLMKASTPDEMAVNHVLDSLAAAAHLAPLLASRGAAPVTVGDIGSGGGCPGLPLAVAFPGVRFVLVERMERRCAFLHGAVARMGLSNVRVDCMAAAAVRPESFDTVVFRAFHPFDAKVAGWLLAMVRKGGHIAAYKARSERIEAEMSAVAQYIPSYKKIPLTVPFLEDHERHLVVIQK